MIDLIGYFAALLTTASFLPQTLMSIKTKNTDGISLAMYSIFASGVSFWLIYGLIIGNFVVILANSVTLPLALTILYIKINNSFSKKR